MSDAALALAAFDLLLILGLAAGIAVVVVNARKMLRPTRNGARRKAPVG
jgi:hypothetical protein